MVLHLLPNFTESPWAEVDCFLLHFIGRSNLSEIPPGVLERGVWELTLGTAKELFLGGEKKANVIFAAVLQVFPLLWCGWGTTVGGISAPQHREKGASIECEELTWGEAAQPPPTSWGCTVGQDPAL